MVISVPADGGEGQVVNVIPADNLAYACHGYAVPRDTIDIAVFEDVFGVI